MIINKEQLDPITEHKVLDALSEIRKSGQANMFDKAAVISIAYSLGYYEVVTALQGLTSSAYVSLLICIPS